MRSKKALLNIVSNLILQVIIVLYGFIVPKIIIGHFGSDVNGLVTSITQFLAYITLLESGFGPVVKAALYKPIADNDQKSIANILHKTEKFFKTIAIIFLIYIFVLCFLYPLLVIKDFEWVYTISLIVIIGISTFAEYFFGMTYRLFLQAEQKTYVISAIQIITYLLAIVIIVLSVKAGMNIHIVKLISGIVFLLRPLLQNYYVKKKYNIKLEIADNNYDLKQKWDGLAQHIASVIHENTDVTILTIFKTLSEVSVYSVYYLVVKGIKSMIQSFTSGIDATFGDMIARNEKKNLQKKFGVYEVIYNTISVFTFTCAIILIVPFISVYTSGISDANYIRQTFGILIVISEYIWAIRLPYNSVVLAAGHFKETRTGAWIECITNIVISIILVNKFGLVGVTIGTIVAMTIRTIEFIYHTNKYILDRSIWYSIKNLLIVIFETIIIVFISSYIPFLSNVNYINWLINALMVVAISIIIIFSINVFAYKSEILDVFQLLKKILKKKK